MLPFTTMLVRLSLAPLEIARAYSEAFSSADSIGASKLVIPKVDPYQGNASAAARFISSGSCLPAGQPTYQAKAMSAQFHDNQVATVDYQILFTKRGNETILQSGTTVVAKAMTGSGFASWKIAQFVRRPLKKPADWSDEDWKEFTQDFTEDFTDATSPPNTDTPKRLKEKYLEFLQVEYQVLSTLDRKGPTNEIAALLEIANAIKEKK
jgi:hypothetical protein